MSKLAGKVAVVTGASKGIGAAVAREFGAAGAAVVVNYGTDEDGAARVVADIRAQGGKAVAVRGDVARAEDASALFDASAQAFGRLDVLANCAGVYRLFPLDMMTEAELHRQFGINVFGLLHVTREAARRFGPEGGSIINIGSAVTRTSPPGSSVYAATKGAVDAITAVLAKELGPRKIRVNSINPGATETEGFRAMGMAGTELEAQMIARTPLGRLGQPEDIARIAVFLASADSGWVTGEILLASGGYR